MKCSMIAFVILLVTYTEINAISQLAQNLSCNFARNQTCGYSLLNVIQTEDGIKSVVNSTSVVVKSFEANETLCVSVSYSVEGDRIGSLMYNNVTIELMRHTTKEDRGGAYITPPQMKPGRKYTNSEI